MGIAVFNELRITPDNKYIIIDVSVSNEPYYKDVYLDSIVIDNQDTYVGNGVSSKAIYSYTIQGDKKHIRLTLDRYDLGSMDSLFFVYARIKGTPSSDTPCGMDNVTTMGTVTNMYPFYQQAMDYIKELGNKCSVPQGFTDYILRLKALELSIRTGNYTDAIKYYDKFFKGKVISINGGCGCGNN